MARKTGISNRESADQEEAERREHPPLNKPEPADGGAPGARGTEHKEGTSRHGTASMPQTRKAGGAFGREPDAAEESREGTSHPGRGEE